jgi:hypothetical protein
MQRHFHYGLLLYARDRDGATSTGWPLRDEA